MSSANANYCVVDNIVYNKDKTKIVSACNVLPTVHIPQTVTEIAPYAFEGNTRINKLYIEHAPGIGDFAFADCSNLSEAYFYSYSVPSMGIGAFWITILRYIRRTVFRENTVPRFPVIQTVLPPSPLKLRL